MLYKLWHETLILISWFIVWYCEICMLEEKNQSSTLYKTYTRHAETQRAQPRKTRWSSYRSKTRKLLGQVMGVLFISIVCLGLQKESNGLVEKGSWVHQVQVTKDNHQTTDKIQRVDLFHYFARKKAFHYVFQVAEPHWGDTHSIPLSSS